MVAETRFTFGKNWADYAANISEAELASAIEGLKRLLPEGFNPKGKSLLDIGSGSGLHAVAAHRLGFSPITATDYDEDSVSTTKATAASFGAPVEAFRDDILNTTLKGKWDVVYSWGVLHHTGDVAAAIRNASALVEEGGVFIIAIYVETPFCGVWTSIKRTYSAASRPVQAAMEAGYMAALRARGAKSSGVRGMNFKNDAIDWLGGYPYESASPDRVTEIVGPQFKQVRAFGTKAGRGIFGTGCAEYTFIRD